MATRSWHRDRSRRMASRARSEEAEAKIADFCARRPRNIARPMSKAELRTLGEQLLDDHRKKQEGG